MRLLHLEAAAADWKRRLASVSCAGFMTLWPATHLRAAGVGDESGPVVLEEIMVVAQRREENSQKVPITVDTVSGVDALQRGTSSIQTLSATIPNLTFTTASFATNTYIRGVGDNSASPNNEPSAAVYVDGVYNPAAMALTSFNFNNIEQIEVLKGPQGTLFGRNATAGVIQILTPDPKSDFSGKVDAGYGNYGTIDAGTYVTGGLTKSLSADLSVLYHDQNDGFGHNLTYGTPTFRQKDAAARSKWLYEPSNSTKIHFSADYPGAYNSFGTPTNDNNVQWGAAARVDQDLGELLRGVSITSYRNVSGDLTIDSVI
jgi:iron complex outermembrane receptor protein